MTARRTQRLCDWCFTPLADEAEELNGGIGHPECVRWVHECVAGPDAMPMPRRRYYRTDPILVFLDRLARAAVRQGIDQHKLARAVEEASR